MTASPRFLNKARRFVDYKRLRICGGRGGDGAISFARTSRVPFGPADGGSGGNGGNIHVSASKELTSLHGIQTTYVGNNGEAGRGSGRHGSAGADIGLVVPIGTTVKEIDPPEWYTSPSSKKVDVKSILNPSSPAEYTNEYRRRSASISVDGLDELSEAEYEMTPQVQLARQLYKFRHDYFPRPDRLKYILERAPQWMPPPPKIELDLMVDGERHVLARGGRGGAGNPTFVSAEMRGPGMAGRGEDGYETFIELELKTIADCGLVGIPNAGKSSLLAAISNAHPKIAAYPFTTLNPYIGTVQWPDSWSLTVADIPGLIAGAHLNKGLGHNFLRHIERARVLVYVIDASGNAPWDDLATLRFELEAYRSGLTDKPSVVIANKADLDAAQSNMEELRSRAGCTVVECSALERRNVEQVTGVLRELVSAITKKKEEEQEEENVNNNNTSHL
ncbi:hypothetical protein SmJEL517_g01811 [Synchytrium microbalum]|uniref:Obg family GTPase CgtA n=1 Tax=Synchytrium microbalum TaxID=1806994 RepID=A0A507C4R5_9FUNG|nr:uncharacterized protein SmJEL517_g01811 [Synchytrium microbalum]TPX35977.1 hypothetical protein SmJEL517_g01811 [Synchytrium microbalum]